MNTGQKDQTQKQLNEQQEKADNKQQEQEKLNQERQQVEEGGEEQQGDQQMEGEEEAEEGGQKQGQEQFNQDGGEQDEGEDQAEDQKQKQKGEQQEQEQGEQMVDQKQQNDQKQIQSENNKEEGQKQKQKQDKIEVQKQKNNANQYKQPNKMVQQKPSIKQSSSQSINPQSKRQNNKPQQQHKNVKNTAPLTETQPKQTPVSNEQQPVQVHRTAQQGMSIQTQQPAIQLISQSHKSRYINTLQNNLNKKNFQIKLLTAKSTGQSTQILTLQEQNKKLKEKIDREQTNYKQIEQKYKAMQMAFTQQQKKIERLQQQLRSYREIGDIRLLLGKVEQLQSMVQIQNNQIKLIKQENNENMGNREQQMVGEDKITVRQYLNNLEQLRSQKQKLQTQIIDLNRILENKNKQSTQAQQIMNQMDLNIKNNVQIINRCKQEIDKLQREKAQLKIGYEQKIGTLERYIQIHSGKNINRSLSISDSDANQPNNDGKVRTNSIEGIDQQQLENQNARTQKIQGQKDIIFRQYLKLEIDYKNTQESLKEIKNRYLETCKQVRMIRKDMISKKDYEDILNKYRKCKLCLQKAIKANKLLRIQNNNSNNNNVGQMIGQSKQRQINKPLNNSNIVSQQQNNIAKYLQVYNQHVEQSIKYFKNTNSIMENIHFQKLQNQINNKEQIIKDLQAKNQTLENFNNIFQRELVYKNSLIQSIIEDSNNVRKEYEKVLQEKLTIQSTLAQNIFAKSALQKLSAKSAKLLIRNRKVVTQKQNWKSLYEKLKNRYDAYVSKDSNQNQNYKQKQPQANNDQKKKQSAQQGQIQQPQNTKILQPVKKTATITSQTQTEGLNQLYYKQIKQTLSSLKKFPELIKSATSNYEKIGKELEQYKKKFDNINLKFNLKFKQLQNEKNENESWRESAKKQIISDFQDIRELVENDRLLCCLRKAKNLIQYLEQEQQEQEAEPAAASQ